MSNKEVSEDFRNMIEEFRRLQEKDISRLATQASAQVFEGDTDVAMGINVIDFCNVTASVVTSLQGIGTPPGDTTPPAQVTGLSVGSPTGSSLNLSWTANAEGDLDHYNVYRGSTPGFTVTPGATTPTGLPATNSFADSGLTSSTTYYYKVLAADTSGNLGTLSTEASGTTSAAPSGPPPSLWLKLDNSLADASANSNSTTATTATYGTPGKFGSHYYVQNTGATSDYLQTANSSSTQLDFTNGFSYSLWIYPISTTQTAVIIDKQTDAANQVMLNLTSSGNLRAVVTHATTDRGFQIAYTANVWQHIVLTYNPATTTVKLYRDKVAATTSNTFHPVASHSALFIGNGTAAMDQPFKGRLDEVQYFKGTVLTQTQVDNLFATNAP